MLHCIYHDFWTSSAVIPMPLNPAGSYLEILHFRFYCIGGFCLFFDSDSPTTTSTRLLCFHLLRGRIFWKFLGVRKEFRSARNVLAKDLGNNDTLDLLAPSRNVGQRELTSSFW